MAFVYFGCVINLRKVARSIKLSLIARFMGPTRGQPGSCRPQVDPMYASWTLLSEMFIYVAVRIIGQMYGCQCISMEFHGILSRSKLPWNPTFWGKIKSSMDIHGTREYGKNPWNSMQLWIWTKFHGIPWNLRFCCSSSMEFHGTTGVV